MSTHTFNRRVDLKIQALVFVVIGIFGFAATAAPAVIWCEDQSSGKIREIDNQLVRQGDDCVAAIIWARNVCFEGSATSLAQRINSGDFVWVSDGLMATEALVKSEKAVLYTGVDQRSFYSSERTILACSPEFLARLRR